MLLQNKQASKTAAGPLIVSNVNPRYFTIGSGKDAERRAVYLTGSHVWNNFHDGQGSGPDCAETPEQFDYDAYLQFLTDHGHNFIRLWRWEQIKSQPTSTHHMCMTPQPWVRSGLGMAKDGKPKFDLESLDQAYFDRLRNRVVAAGERGIYVAVMLFEGFALHLSLAPDNIEGHPFYHANNVNGINITSINDYQVLPLDPRVQALQEVYIRKVVDTVQDLPNVLYEVANESSGGGSVDQVFAKMIGLSSPPQWGDSTGWQYWVIEVVKRYEQDQGYDQHPIGMTMQFPVADQTRVNEPLFNSPADWISPGYDDAIFTHGRHPMAPGSPPSRWYDNPPAADGKKVIITDTDHYAAGKGDALWAWKSFLRGHNPILMDFGLTEGVIPPDPSSESFGTSPYHAFEPARYAMGDTLHLAQQINLLEMEPSSELSSTRYALANPGAEYLVLQTDDFAGPFTVELADGSYLVQWHSINRRETKEAGEITVPDHGSITFTAPFTEAGPAVLYLKRVGHR